MEDRPLNASVGWIRALAAGGAAHAALVVAPALAAPAAPDGPWVLAALAGPVLLLVGLARRSRAALLVGVPAGWVLPAHGLAPAPPDPALTAVGLAAIAGYVPAACAFLTPRPAPEAVDWAALDDAAATPRRDLVPWIAALVVAAPAAGVACWPAFAEAAARGFPDLPGLALVGLALVGTLTGLAIATDLFRGRPALRGSRARAGVLGLLAAALLGLLAASGG